MRRHVYCSIHGDGMNWPFKCMPVYYYTFALLCATPSPLSYSAPTAVSAAVQATCIVWAKTHVQTRFKGDSSLIAMTAEQRARIRGYAAERIQLENLFAHNVT